MEERLCLECNQPLTGRIDKKFCDDQCRSAYNNRANNNTTAMMRKINGVLKKNRLVLMDMCPNGKSKVKKDKIVSKGLDINYHTHTYKTKDGAIYYFCYEYAWLHIDNEYILIVKNDKKEIV